MGEYPEARNSFDEACAYYRECMNEAVAIAVACGAPLDPEFVENVTARIPEIVRERAASCTLIDPDGSVRPIVLNRGAPKMKFEHR